MQLPKLMTFLKSKTGKIFVPSSIVNSPANPNSELLLLLRPSDLVDRSLFEPDLGYDELAIAKRFTVRMFQFMAKDPEMRVD